MEGMSENINQIVPQLSKAVCPPTALLYFFLSPALLHFEHSLALTRIGRSGSV